MEKFQEIIVKDSLRHDKYRWPLTLLSYPIILEEGTDENDWELLDESGEEVEFQVSDIRKEGGRVKSLCLHFLCSLSKGEEKRYYFQYGNGCVVRETTFSCDFDFEVWKEKRQFCVSYGEKRMVCSLDFEDISCAEGNKGSLFQETEILCRGSRGQEYHLGIKRIKGMPFWELTEEMKGFTGTEQMRMSFQGFDFTHRYSWQRPVEKIDAYLVENHKLPVTIMPYENWNPWFQSKYIAFLSQNQSAGLFIRDNLGWDDGTYPLWGARREFGITFTYERGCVEGYFPLKDGKRFVGVAAYEGSDSRYIEYLWLWYAFLHLNKTKDWILEWEEDKSRYPRFFDKKLAYGLKEQVAFCESGERIPADRMMEVVDRLSPSMNRIGNLNPVDNREFSDWTVLVDLTADEMTQEQFDHVKAAFAFMAYAAMDENYMPTVNMLAGHPNFLFDTASVAGFAAALFPGHPRNRMFQDYFSRAAGLNLKYHIRPDVEEYQSLGGRATENLGCYNFAALRPAMRVCTLFAACGYQIPLNTRQGAKWLNWMVNCLSAPVDGRRILPPQGAHAAKYADGYLEIPYILYHFARLLLKEYPEAAGNALAACEGSCLNSLEYANMEDDIWRTLLVRGESSCPLQLASEKFTGYGYLFREGVGTPEEISIHVQQLDQGPHYRWGTFRNTGNGGIHYYAAGRRYSYNCLEDTGDRNLGAEEGSCGFAVLKGHTYYNIGFHDLTEPLFDFPLIKQGTLLAGEEIEQFYRYRRVALVEKDYIVIYDAVTHMRARGRFTWTVNALEEFPGILQLKPGAQGTDSPVKGSVEIAGDDGMTHPDPRYRSKTLAFDGDGDFLTIVSHREGVRAKATEYGAVVELDGRRDYIFEDGARSRVKEGKMRFLGYSGILSIRGNGMVKGALLDGEMIAVDDLCVELAGDLKESRCAVFFEKKGRTWQGGIIAVTDTTVRINGEAMTLKRGRYEWELKDGIRVRRLEDRVYDGDGGFVRDTRRHEFGFYGTDFYEQGRILRYPGSGGAD